jgi:hypothetical protein
MVSGIGHGVCLTELDVLNKQVSIIDFANKAGSLITINFNEAVVENSTLSINGEISKPIYLNG